MTQKHEVLSDEEDELLVTVKKRKPRSESSVLNKRKVTKWELDELFADEDYDDEEEMYGV